MLAKIFKCKCHWLARMLGEPCQTSSREHVVENLRNVKGFYHTEIITRNNVIICICIGNQAIGQMSRVFDNGPGDRGLIPGQVIPETQRLVLDTALLNTQHFKVRIKGKVEQSME